MCNLKSASQVGVITRKERRWSPWESTNREKLFACYRALKLKTVGNSKYITVLNWYQAHGHTVLEWIAKFLRREICNYRLHQNSGMLWFTTIFVTCLVLSNNVHFQYWSFVLYLLNFGAIINICWLIYVVRTISYIWLLRNMTWQLTSICYYATFVIENT